MRYVINLIILGTLVIACSSSNQSLLQQNRKPALRGINIDAQLSKIHGFYTLAQYHLSQFDKTLKKSTLEELYQSDPYLILLLIRAEVESIEHEIIDSMSMNKSFGATELAKVMSIKKFSEQSKLKYMSMENLIGKLELQESGYFLNHHKLNKLYYRLDSQTVSKELNELRKDREFQELEIRLKASIGEIRPAITKEGNITGNEFPAKVWSLTFDDGPGKNTSPLILESLKQHELKATFFQLAGVAKKLPLVAKQINDAGMEIASHSYTHPQLPKLDEAGLNKEIITATQELESLHGVDIKFFRNPYGAGVNNTLIRQKLTSIGLIHVFWNIDTLDWMAQEPSSIVDRAIEQMKKTPKDAGIILFHDIHARTTQAAPIVMDYLKKDNRRVCTLDVIITQMNEGKETVCPSK